VRFVESSPTCKSSPQYSKGFECFPNRILRTAPKALLIFVYDYAFELYATILSTAKAMSVMLDAEKSAKRIITTLDVF